MDNQQLWQAILGEMELLISKPNFTTWFKQTYVHYNEKNLVVIAVPNAFTKKWFEDKYQNLIAKAVENITDNRSVKIDYKIIPTSKKPEESKPTQKSVSLEQNNLFSAGLNPKYTFQNYIIGKGNELAQAASRAIVKKPGEAYNPLFIYGGVGLGKTHLMQAVGNEIFKKNPSSKILYVPCEKFVNDFIQALSVNNTKSFKERYRKIDVLLVDDIQFLSGKEQTQEAFFHTFNELHQANKQIILTSDRPPKSIATLEDRLISRFEWGMIADVSSPDFETRSAILKYKAKEKNFKIKNEVIDFLASNIKSNVRELEGALNKIIAFHEIKDITPDLESVGKVLINLKSLPQKKSFHVKTLFKIVTDFYSISVNDLIGACRKKHLVGPRQITMYLMREEMKSSYPAIGQELGGRDHTTAMHACNKIEAQLEIDESLKQNIETIKQKIYSSF
ncbi:chromosomal replication initiator protein DnaA [Candidatus Falkowbacteria bacterium]|jgi:chromosomal replication initiator protein|nr:chromosomal replication initiator protein DnaA [Candidatus Falkowbacteria bacterium]MBT4432785.1 chromosomal replication initiator protein DnaA [Candidatus Falkowbacteria bacterium]